MEVCRGVTRVGDALVDVVDALEVDAFRRDLDRAGVRTS